MDSDFDFSLEQEPVVPPTADAPPGIWAQMPLERLPPTRIPTHERCSIRQRMRQSHFGHGLRRFVPPIASLDHRIDAPTTNPLSPARPHSSEGEGRGGGPTAAPVSISQDDDSVPLLGGGPGSSKRRVEWKEEEVAQFYGYLSQFGLDFGAIAVMFPGRTRKDVSKLYVRERKRRGKEVEKALNSRAEIDVEQFSELLNERREQEEAHRKELAPEELALLEQIERGDAADVGPSSSEPVGAEESPLPEVPDTGRKRRRKQPSPDSGEAEEKVKKERKPKEGKKSSSGNTPAVVHDPDDNLTLLEFARKIQVEDDMLLSDFAKAHESRQKQETEEKEFAF